MTLRPSPYAYHPFGAGPRLCIGGPLATAIIRIALERILSRYRLSVVPGSDIGSAYGIYDAISDERRADANSCRRWQLFEQSGRGKYP